MAMQQRAFCWTAGAGSLGSTGVKEARLTANTANSIRARNFIEDTLPHRTIFESATRSTRVVSYATSLLMISRIALSLATMAALTMAPLHLSARTCILSDAPAQKACKPGCCANKSCCATSKKSAPVSPLATNSSGSELNATCVATVVIACPDYVSLDRHLSVARSSLCAFASPQLAVLCTFLI